MPGGDGTGPGGMGPMTGRAAGYCAGYPVPGFMNPIPGRGFWGSGSYYRPMGGMYGGLGYAPGYGGSPFGAPYSRETARKQELDFLKGQAEYFEDIVEGINKRIEELQAEGEAK